MFKFHSQSVGIALLPFLLPNLQRDTTQSEYLVWDGWVYALKVCSPKSLQVKWWKIYNSHIIIKWSLSAPEWFLWRRSQFFKFLIIGSASLNLDLRSVDMLCFFFFLRTLWPKWITFCFIILLICIYFWGSWLPFLE